MLLNICLNVVSYAVYICLLNRLLYHCVISIGGTSYADAKLFAIFSFGWTRRNITYMKTTFIFYLDPIIFDGVYNSFSYFTACLTLLAWFRIPEIPTAYPFILEENGTKNGYHEIIWKFIRYVNGMQFSLAIVLKQAMY